MRKALAEALEKESQKLRNTTVTGSHVRHDTEACRSRRCDGNLRTGTHAAELLNRHLVEGLEKR